MGTSLRAAGVRKTSTSASYKQPLLAIAVALLAAAVPANAIADNPGNGKNRPDAEQTVIANDSFRLATGAIHVNQTAGSANLQANVLVIVRGSKPAVSVSQTTDAGGSASGLATIADRSFAGAVGAIQVNQSAGVGNAQGNVIVVQLGAGATQLDDSSMAAVLPAQHTSHGAGSSATAESVTSSSQAFAKSSGIVQVNQIAGSGNATANTFSMQIQHGTGGP